MDMDPLFSTFPPDLGEEDVGEYGECFEWLLQEKWGEDDIEQVSWQQQNRGIEAAFRKKGRHNPTEAGMGDHALPSESSTETHMNGNRKRARNDSSESDTTFERKEKNRKSAALSRERKKAAMDQMMLRCKALESTNATLNYLLSMANMEVHTLRKELASLNTSASGKSSAEPAEQNIIKKNLDFLPTKSPPKSLSTPFPKVRSNQRLRYLLCSLCLVSNLVDHPGLAESRRVAKRFIQTMASKGQAPHSDSLEGKENQVVRSLACHHAALRRWHRRKSVKVAGSASALAPLACAT
mmetsp:Transcript_7424/g.19055  ORF Transcript_7424/g.19055 Transcript_7424/m.19055 type:complete len:296 (+) Transcript_7424:127-1014(+)